MFKNVPALTVSIIIHAVVLAVMYGWTLQSHFSQPELVVETVFTEERPAEEYTQEMSIDTSVSQSLSISGGGAVTGKLGSTSGNPVAATQRVEQSKALKAGKVSVPQMSMPSLGVGSGDINLDLGQGEVSGEIGAKVEGYGAAMHRMTHEMRRMMRDNQMIVVWLFDASKSLESDRKEIADNFHKIYEELEIAKEQADRKNQKYNSLETVVCGFGADVKKLVPKPTADVKEIRAAIGKITEDASGKEMVFNSIRTVLEEYGRMARSTNRKLAIVVVTDESGDDPEILEDVVDKSKLYKAPVYMLGRESIFGYPYARITWRNPETGVEYWTTIDRGPETAMPECLQYNGFDARYDSASSGFAPYALARLIKESGGIFFMLQSAEADLAGQSVSAKLVRKFDDIRMKQYEPGLEPVRDYVKERDSSQFRKTIWQVIARLNPHTDRDLVITYHYAIDNAAFKEQAREPFQRGLRAMKLINAAITDIEKIAKLRDAEPDARWRASYDLLYAQLLAYRVRVFQYLLATDQHVKDQPTPKSPKSNRWDRTYAGKLLEPSEAQVKATGVDLKELEAQRKKALDMYTKIIKDHPDTPWAQRAAQERGWGFGMQFVDRFHDERYFDEKERAKIPKF